LEVGLQAWWLHVCEARLVSGKRYSEIEIDKALIAAATLGIRPAARALSVPEATIRSWMRDKPERYAEIKATEAPKWRERAAAEFEDVVDDLTEVERTVATRLRDRVEKLEDKDLARTLKDVSTSKGINSQHVHQLRDRPAQVIEHKVNLTLVQKAIAQLEEDDVEGTAEELPSREDAIRGLPHLTPDLPPAA
jgi:hypothetical protein